MINIRTFHYRPRLGLVISVLGMLLLVVLAIVFVAVYAPHAAGVSAVDRVGDDWSELFHRRWGIWLGHRASFAIGVLSFGVVFALGWLRLHQARQHTCLLLGRRQLVVPAIFWLSKPVTVPYAAITRLQVEKRYMGRSWPFFRKVLQVSYAGDAGAQTCELSRVLLPNRHDFDLLCGMLSHNVRQVNPAYVPDALNLPHVPRAELGLAD